jgi:hypothetical protein
LQWFPWGHALCYFHARIKRKRPDGWNCSKRCIELWVEYLKESRSELHLIFSLEEIRGRRSVFFVNVENFIFAAEQ